MAGSWNDYVDLLRHHLATHERMLSRMPAILGDPPTIPGDEARREWIGLVREAEIAAIQHRRALESALRALED